MQLSDEVLKKAEAKKHELRVMMMDMIGHALELKKEADSVKSVVEKEMERMEREAIPNDKERENILRLQFHYIHTAGECAGYKECIERIADFFEIDLGIGDE